MKMFKKMLALMLALITLSGCSAKTEVYTPPVDEVPDAAEPVLYKNPLTGVREFETEDKLSLRPVAVMVNNQKIARSAQTGLQTADIVYETYVEGGITRTLAIYKDIADAGEIGSIRSARYDFVDIACSHDAAYIHAGEDPTYCVPYMNSLGLDDANLLLSSLYSYAYRLDNGLILEHTLYSTGKKLNQMLTDKGWRMTVNEAHSDEWQSFNETATACAGGSATHINVKFSGDYTSVFDYDTEKDTYVKGEHKDWRSGENLEFKNIVVLFTTLGNRGDGYRVKIGMESGNGYYFSNGTYQEINWTKGGTYDSFKFTDKDGSALAYNPGNSWVCLVSSGMQGGFSFN